MKFSRFSCLQVAITLWCGTCVGASQAQAVSLSLKGVEQQGGIMRGETEPGTRVSLNGKPVQVSPQGFFVIGFDRDHKGDARLVLSGTDGSSLERVITVALRKYVTQHVNGVAAKYVNPKPETLKRIRAEGKIKGKARRLNTKGEWFVDDFVWPVTGILTGTFGSQRFYNGEPRRPHFGVDIARPTGTPVQAPAPGIIRLAEPDMYFEGGLIFLDHGHGLISVMMHLSRVDVVVGQKVEQGDIIGAVGATGRVTGAHLDWRMKWQKANVDPANLVGPMPKHVPQKSPAKPIARPQ